MTPSLVFQPVNNVALPPQSGENFVVKQEIQLNGGDTLIGFSASAYSANPGTLSMELWLDGEPTGGRLAMHTDLGEFHLSLGHSWVYVPKLSNGEHTLALFAGLGTMTDQNDRACITIWEMSDGCAVRFADDAPSPQGVGSGLINARFHSIGGQVLVSGCASGFVASQGLITARMPLDGATPGVATQVFSNSAGNHLVTVPTDYVHAGPISRGQHQVQLNADSAMSTSSGDMAHLAVVEWIDPAQAPVACAMNPPLVGAQAQSQHGDGGSVAQSQFSKGNGRLLVKVGLSAWTSQSGGVPLSVGIQIDGTTLGFVNVWANAANSHMSMVTNALVLKGIAPGVHTVNLIGEANTITDLNDRVSVTILEFPTP